MQELCCSLWVALQATGVQKQFDEGDRQMMKDRHSAKQACAELRQDLLLQSSAICAGARSALCAGCVSVSEAHHKTTSTLHVHGPSDVCFKSRWVSAASRV